MHEWPDGVGRTFRACGGTTEAGNLGSPRPPGGMMADFTDLQIQFRLAKKPSSDGTQSTHEVLATIDGSGSWRGESTIDYAQLAEAEQDPRQYGKRLGEVLFNPAIMNALRQARGLLDRPVRIRLWLEMGPNGEREDQHGLRWERAYIVVNEKDWPLAIAPGLPFSRYVPAESIDPDASDDSVFRLLVVFASPDNLASEQQPIEVDADLSTLLDGIDLLTQGRRFRLVVMPGRTGISAALQERLAESGTEGRRGTVDDRLDRAERARLPRPAYRRPRHHEPGDAARFARPRRQGRTPCLRVR